MKYTIEGIDKSKIIKSTQILEKVENSKKIKAIMVNYLDGTQDVFEASEENINRIIKIAEEQANIYVKNKDKKINKIVYLRNTSASSTALTGLMIAIFWDSTPSRIFAMILTPILVAIKCIISNKKIKYIEKYDLYVNSIKDRLVEYKEIIEKEKKLTKSKKQTSTKLDNVLDLDRVSLSELKTINNKVERYNKIEENQQKIKTLENTGKY